MVLSWRDDSHAGPSNRVFDGSGDVRMFLFYFENVAMRGKKQEEKALELLSYLDGKAFEFFFARFTKEGCLTTEGQDFKTIKDALVLEFEEKEELQEIIRRAMVATLDPSNLVSSMAAMDTPVH